jgi:hypothetical protein
VERQMRNWEISRQQHLAEDPPQEDTVQDFICISRMVGISERGIAEALGERLEWPVFGKEILEAMSGDDEIRRQIYASMDQRDLSWWEGVLRPFVQDEFVRNDYFRRLCETMFSLACQGHGIFVGRGADLILPRSTGFRVRLVAPREDRIAAWSEARHVDFETAQRELSQVESLRQAFFRNHFRVEAEDLTRHDLVLNLSSFSASQAVKLILQSREHHRQNRSAGS